MLYRQTLHVVVTLHKLNFSVFSSTIWSNKSWEGDIDYFQDFCLHNIIPIVSFARNRRCNWWVSSHHFRLHNNKDRLTKYFRNVYSFSDVYINLVVVKYFTRSPVGQCRLFGWLATLQDSLSVSYWGPWRWGWQAVSKRRQQTTDVRQVTFLKSEDLKAET